ncbi:MAG: NAD(+)/NADH kinase [Kosmotoga sp.]|uniref:NAD(+)/NADH kinase n=1 Tax=Kosmotoga sp. TaxID=1955248 RepID=UPI001D574A27|nr:NAD(+)/NADH kinase [Kosmotoga sp.]MBO8166772.1 NAD(+)/NADH kinase [Kosmotoga sp.]
MKALVFFNTSRIVQEDLENIGHQLKSQGIDMVICEKQRGCIERDVQLILTFGGDGTVLKAVPCALENSIPILSFKIGSVGFLSAFELHQLEEALNLYLNSMLIEDNRTLLKIGGVLGTEYALNDFVLERSKPSRTIYLRVMIEGFSPYIIAGDGIIISTPTGSTAYNLAAGGAIIDPSSDVYQVTPLSPHNPYVGCIVVGASRRTVIELLDDRGYPMDCYNDGVFRGNLEKGHKVEVALSKRSVTLLRPKEFDFVGVMRDKLAFGGRLRDDFKKR